MATESGSYLLDFHVEVVKSRIFATCAAHGTALLYYFSVSISNAHQKRMTYSADWWRYQELDVTHYTESVHISETLTDIYIQFESNQIYMTSQQARAKSYRRAKENTRTLNENNNQKVSVSHIL